MNRLSSARMGWWDAAGHVRAPLLRLSALTVLCLTVGWIPFAHANPVPMTYLGVAVREESGGFCDEWPFVECQGVTDVTDLTGRLEFDFYLTSFFPDSLVWEDVRWRVDWPSDWSFVAAQVCGGFIVEQSGNQVILEKPDLLATGPSPEYIRALATVVLDVTSRGRLTSRYLSGDMGFLYEPEWDGRADAGYPCGGCPNRSCWGGFPFDPWFFPGSLALEVPMGSVTQETFEVYAEYGDDETLLFSSSVPWMTIEEVEQHDSEYSVTVRISAQGLPPGDHQGLLLADASACTECAQVQLTVLDASGTEEGTWGALKRRFVRGSR
ncbi:MAG: hypothetical protein KBD56_04145 [Candidatus Eisenbacteria bacterium]|nr:hypothetical protein [Candidatus Eisenbacteria bacterium]